jgi:hypothetical protein
VGFLQRRAANNLVKRMDLAYFGEVDRLRKRGFPGTHDAKGVFGVHKLAWGVVQNDVLRRSAYGVFGEQAKQVEVSYVVRLGERYGVTAQELDEYKAAENKRFVEATLEELRDAVRRIEATPRLRPSCRIAWR